MEEPEGPDSSPRTPLERYESVRDVVRAAYPTLVADTVVERTPGDAPRNLRIHLVDDGFLDVWLADERYSHHWQSGDDVVRFDNAPHHDHVNTHPHHRHVDDRVEESPLVGEPTGDVRTVMDYLEENRLA